MPRYKTHQIKEGHYSCKMNFIDSSVKNILRLFSGLTCIDKCVKFTDKYESFPVCMQKY